MILIFKICLCFVFFLGTGTLHMLGFREMHAVTFCSKMWYEECVCVFVG